MLHLTGRLFLLGLLGVDWAADPSVLPPAIQALAAPMASTECACPSLGHRQVIRTESKPDPRPNFLACETSSAAVAWEPIELSAVTPVPFESSTRRTYILMSLRC